MTRNDGQFDNNDALDRALDAALANHTTVEPRAGLEARILANLRTVGQSREVTTWRWGLAAALAMIVMALGVAWRFEMPSQPNIAIQPPAFVAPADALTPVVHRDVVHKRPRKIHGAQAQESAAANPRLDTFPSPQQLSKEEIALTRYVREFPAEARLIAQAETEDEVQLEKEMEQARSDAGSSSQQER